MTMTPSQNREAYLRYKIKAIMKVTGGLVGCQVCGFPIVRALQFDHVVEIGNRELRKTSKGAERGGASMVRAINNGTQDVTALNVLCANCHCLKGQN
jgi:5-methylcytosine-specific restriction endonuclease McrA